MTHFNVTAQSGTMTRGRSVLGSSARTKPTGGSCRGDDAMHLLHPQGDCAQRVGPTCDARSLPTHPAGSSSARSCLMVNFHLPRCSGSERRVSFCAGRQTPMTALIYWLCASLCLFVLTGRCNAECRVGWGHWGGGCIVSEHGSFRSSFEVVFTHQAPTWPH